MAWSWQLPHICRASSQYATCLVALSNEMLVVAWLQINQRNSDIGQTTLKQVVHIFWKKWAKQHQLLEKNFKPGWPKHFMFYQPFSPALLQTNLCSTLPSLVPVRLDLGDLGAIFGTAVPVGPQTCINLLWFVLTCCCLSVHCRTSPRQTRSKSSHAAMPPCLVVVLVTFDDLIQVCHCTWQIL